MITFYLPSRKTKPKNGYVTVMFSVPTLEETGPSRLQMSSKIKIKPEWWEKRKSNTFLRLSADPACKDVEEQLSKFKDTFEYVYRKLELRLGHKPSKRLLKENWEANQRIIAETNQEKKPLLDFIYKLATEPSFWKSYQLNREIKKATTLEIYATLHKHLVSFQEYSGFTVTWDSIASDQFKNQFIDYLEKATFNRPINIKYPRYPRQGVDLDWTIPNHDYSKKPISRSVINKYLSRFRTALNEAKKHEGYEVTSNTVSKATSKVVVTQAEKDKTRAKRLTYSLDELKVIQAASLEEEHLIRTRDYFIAGCLLGVRISDLLTLKVSEVQTNINGHKFLKRQPIKTKETVDFVKVPIQPAVQTIIDKYNDGEFLFPRLSDQVFNRQIKEVLQIIGKQGQSDLHHGIFSKALLTASHSMRRTFCTFYVVDLKVPAELVMKLSGHKKIDQLLEYINVDETRYDELIEEALSKIDISLSLDHNEKKALI